MLFLYIIAEIIQNLKFKNLKLFLNLKFEFLNYFLVAFILINLKICDIISIMFNWPHRIVVSTPGFHPGNMGSIPIGATNKLKIALLCNF
jgi:hypothetical protein